MGVGRVFCVALPFLLTIGALIALLTATLSGVVSSDNLHMLRIDLSDFSLDPNVISSAVDSVLNSRDGAPHIGSRQSSTNISAAELSLAKHYDVNLWGYCATYQNGDRDCTKAQFDWAHDVLNSTFYADFGKAAGVDITLPDDIENALKAFSEVTKWTEIVFIIALVALAVEIVVGVFASCSRVASCFTWLIAGVATFFVGAAAALATATAAIVIGAVESTAKLYGVHGDIGGNFLAAVWIATAFAIAAGLFWLLTICCCKSDHRKLRQKNRGSTDGEKLLASSAYAPLSRDMEGGYSNYSRNSFAPQYGAPSIPNMSGQNGPVYEPLSNQQWPGSNHPADHYYEGHHSASGYHEGNARSDLAYEPYSHRA